MNDFLVIGGGIAGISAAAELSKHGSVTLLEAEEALGYHASGRSAATFLEPYGNATVRALNSASLPALQDAEVLSPRRFLLVADNGRSDQFIDEHIDAFGALEISVSEAAQLWPILNTNTCHRAGHLDGVCDLDTDRLLQRFLRTARANGTEIHTGQRVTAISRGAKGWAVRTAETEFSARRIVNAAGAWADQIAAMAGIRQIGLQPFRRSIARIPAPGGLDTRDWPLVDEMGHAWYAKPDAGAWLVSPAEEDPAEPHDAWADDMVIAEGLARYQPFATEEISRLETTWAGLRSFSPDRALVIGPDPDMPDFLWCSGQGGYGFQTSPAAARLLADLATNRVAALPDAAVRALRPDRLR